MNDKTLDELNDMAKRWIDGEVNHLEVVSLKLFDRLLVLELANAYSMCKVGLLSEKYTAVYKLKFFRSTGNSNSKRSICSYSRNSRLTL